MKVKVINNISYQTYPITDDMVEYDDNELRKIGITKQFNKNGNIVDYVDYSLRIAKLKQQLTDTDYKAIKFAEGVISEAEYEPIKKQRQEWRDEINKLEQMV